MNSRFFYLAVPSFFQIFLATRFGLGVDESHYMLYSKNLDWSYFDHPPLVGWFHALFNLVLGWNEFSARAPAILLGYLTTLSCYQYLRERNFREEVAFVGALALSAAFLLMSLQLFLLPDSFLLAGLFPLILVVDRLVRSADLKWWIALGLILGLMGLAKYTSVLFVLPVAWCLVVGRGFKVFRDPGLYVAILIAGLMISPVLYWNYQNDWISFRFQMSHVAGGEPKFSNFLTALGGQIGGYNPFLYVFSVLGFLAALKDQKYRLEALLMVILLLFFVKSSFGEPILPHWTAPFFALALPLGVAKSQWSKYLRFALGLTAFIYFVLMTELLFHWIPPAVAGYRDIKGYDEIANKAVELSDLPVAVGHWTHASRMGFYLNGRRNLFVLDDRKDQYDLWQKEDPQGKDLLILNFSQDNEMPEKHRCGTREELGRHAVTVGGREVYVVRFFLCRQYGI